MIGVTEAKSLLQARVQPLAPVTLPLQQAAGCVLATDVLAQLDLPLSAQSSMDGYAFKFAGWSGEALSVNHVVAAGDTSQVVVEEKEAVRIFTGAYLPTGTDTVVMQEKVKNLDGKIRIDDSAITKGANVRPKGSEISQGSLALQKNTLLSPAAIGFLAMMGVSEVQVTPRPKVAILITGKELQPPGTSPERGKVYEANSFTLQAALQCMGISRVFVNRADDTLAATTQCIDEALAQADILLVTGGISVGDYDFVLPAMLKCGIEKVFHKVAQKPGKPLFFGIKHTKPVFGLPGNPASVLTCFYQYVVPVLRMMMQQENKHVGAQLPLLRDVEKKSGLTHFLKGTVGEKGVNPLSAQESFRLSSFAIANCLIELPENAEKLPAGTLVNVYPFGDYS